MMIRHSLGEEEVKDEGFTYKSTSHEVIDLGDDMYTQGKPHPMIDPEKRIEKLETSADSEDTAVIMLDNVIGYGSHADMASELAPTIKRITDKAKSEERSLVVLATVVGTDKDAQGYDKQREILSEAGAVLCDTNDQMVRTAIELVGGKVEQPALETKNFDKGSEDLSVDSKMMSLISNNPSVINIGLKSFTEAVENSGAEVVQFNWRPVAGGDEKLMKVLQFLNNYEGENV